MSKPYFNSQELDFLKSLPIPETGYLLQTNCGAGEALAQFHELRPRLDLQGVEPSDSLREAFGRHSGHSFSACVWKEESQEEAESYDVIYLSGMKVGDVREPASFKELLDRYRPLLVEGGFLLIEISFANDHGVTSLDRVPWLEKNLQQIDPGEMAMAWHPVPSKERGILSLWKGGSR